MNSRTTKFRWVMWEGVAVSSWFMWTVSSFLSYWGLTHLAPNLPTWMKGIALGFSVVINFVEFMIGQKGWSELWHPKTFGDVVLRVFGLACYAYDILTNVLGFVAIVFAAYSVTQIGQAWQIDPALTVLALIFGFCFAAGPEPVYLEYLQSRFPYPGVLPWVSLMNQAFGFKTSNKVQYQVPKSTYKAEHRPTWGDNQPSNPGPSADLMERLHKKYPDKFK